MHAIGPIAMFHVEPSRVGGDGRLPSQERTSRSRSTLPEGGHRAVSAVARTEMDRNNGLRTARASGNGGMQQKWTRAFLWISVVVWGLLVGAKLFDLRVLVGAWSASPPESLSLLPYGPRWPVDTGEFFIPISAALLLATLGALIAGWRTPARYRVLLALSLQSLAGALASDDLRGPNPYRDRVLAA